MTIDLRELSEAPVDMLNRLSDFLGIAAGHDWETVVSRFATATLGQSPADAISSKIPGLQVSAELLKNRHAKFSVVFGG
jgi:hypothetical protein